MQVGVEDINSDEKSIEGVGVVGVGQNKNAYFGLGCKKAISTQFSRAVPHLSTRHALSHLTSEFGWDPVY